MKSLNVNFTRTHTVPCYRRYSQYMHMVLFSSHGSKSLGIKKFEFYNIMIHPVYYSLHYHVARSYGSSRCLKSSKTTQTRENHGGRGLEGGYMLSLDDARSHGATTCIFGMIVFLIKLEMLCCMTLEISDVPETSLFIKVLFSLKKKKYTTEFS